MAAPESITALVESFADPEVGGVCGNQVYRIPSVGDTTKQGENLYWRYDKWQKLLESRIGSCFAADGSLYAIRSRLFVPMQELAQADDIAISARVVLQGYRLLFEPAAVAYEDAPVEGRDEFRRKVRVTTHSVRALLKLGLPLWSSGFYSVELLSHKLLRHLAPLPLLGLLLSNALLAVRHPAFALLLALQLLFYLLAGVGYLLRGRSAGTIKLFSVPYFFVMVNAAALVGLIKLVLGQKLIQWSPRGGDAV
jgi:cellulose synthase/poly-beta-1,6-N-acetylglucosamine synthase-like glycosyltransferase